MGEMLLDAAADDIPDPDSTRRLMRDLREVRMAKVRAGVGVLEGGREVRMNGVGGMEIAEGRAFIAGVVDGLRWVQFFLTCERSGGVYWLIRNGYATRKIGASKELSRKEREADERENNIGGAGDNDDDEMDM